MAVVGRVEESIYSLPINPPAMRSTRRTLVGALALLALVGAALALSPERALDRLVASVDSPWFPLVLVALYLLRPVLSWPVAVLAALVSFRYGLWVGVPLSLFGTVTASLAPYWTGRYARSEVGLFGRVTGGSERYFDATGDFRGVLAGRLAPAPGGTVSAAAGFADVPVPEYVSGTAVGHLPWTLVGAVAGHSMARLSSAEALGSVDRWLVVGASLVALVLVARPVARAVRAGRAQK